MISIKILYVLLEGSDDERFFNSVLRKKFTNKYDLIKPYMYAQISKKRLKTFIEALNKEKNPLSCFD